MIVVGIIGLFTGVGLVEDAFADHSVFIKKVKQIDAFTLQFKFNGSVDNTNSIDGFDVSKKSKSVPFSLEKINNKVFQITLPSGNKNFNNSYKPYIINYNGSSNNLQHEGEPVPSFSFTKHSSNYKKWDILQNTSTLDNTAPFFQIIKNDKIYSNTFFTFQNANTDRLADYDMVPGEITNIVDELPTTQSISSHVSDGGHSGIIVYSVTDKHGNKSTIREIIIMDNHYDDGLYAFGVYPESGYRNQHIYTEWMDFDLPTVGPVDLIWEIIDIAHNDEKTHQSIHTYEHALMDNVYFVEYVVYWETSNNFFHIIETIISDSDDIDNDGILNIDDRCNLREGPIDNYGCPTSFKDYGVN